MLTLTKTIAANGSVICRLEGELDRFTEDQLRGDLAEVVTPVRLVIDLSRILCYDTVGLAALKDVLQKIQDLGGRASVACDAPALSRFLSESGFERVATVHDTIKGAVASPEMTRPVEEQEIDRG